jgi:hypothetical protein
MERTGGLDTGRFQRGTGRIGHIGDPEDRWVRRRWDTEWAGSTAANEPWAAAFESSVFPKRTRGRLAPPFCFRNHHAWIGAFDQRKPLTPKEKATALSE